MISGKKILIGVTGSIAAYKITILVRLLIKEGAEVRIIMTPAAAQFITPLTLSTLSKNEVLTDLSDGKSWANHVMLGRWADYFIIAPLSCNTLAKMAHGLCDNLLLATYLSATSPVIVAPAMDEDMWMHPSTRNNLEIISGFGNRIIPVEHGELASGLTGEGRMAEPENIVEYLRALMVRQQDCAGLKALVTAGPTHEPIDPVRFIGNRSSGKMGVAIAEELAARGAEVHLVLGPVEISVNGSRIDLTKVETAGEMFEACVKLFDNVDVAILAAAVADYRPQSISPVKIKKVGQSLDLALVKTEDILFTLGQLKQHQILVGFALETNNEVENAREKMSRKNTDLMILNSLRDEGAGFGHNTNRVTILNNAGESFEHELKTKQQVATDIVDKIVKLRHA